MAWWTQLLQIVDADGNPTGRWRLTAKSDEDGGGPFGDSSHDQNDARERAEYERLKAKFG